MHRPDIGDGHERRDIRDEFRKVVAEQPVCDAAQDQNQGEVNGGEFALHKGQGKTKASLTAKGKRSVIPRVAPSVISILYTPPPHPPPPTPPPPPPPPHPP